MLKGNRGDWSEPYVLLKLIAERKLYLGERNFKKIANIFYPILKIISNQKEVAINFSYNGNLVIVDSAATRIEIPINTFLEFSSICLAKIKSVKTTTGTFSIQEVESFLKPFGINRLKEKSKVKSDITIQIEDPKTFLSPILGFSIKSQLGAPSTLVNASNHTNFTYRLSKKLSEHQIKEIKSKRKFADKFNLLESFGVKVYFEKVDSEVFNANLQTIDSSFPRVISDILLDYYRSGGSIAASIQELTKVAAAKNKLKLNLAANPRMYEMMVKKFLLEYALGMKAGEVWYRDYQASGGYLVVREDGEVLCYHFYFIKHLEDYLFQNTKLDTPSSTRYKMAEIYNDHGGQKLRLNLQIRFIK